MVNGFNFNHAHSDFFHFVNFYKGRNVFIDLGRKNYLKKNLRYALEEAHNTIRLGNSGFFDDFLNRDLFTKIGFNELNKKQYLVKRTKNTIKFKIILKNKSIIERNFILMDKSLIIENYFRNLREREKIEMLFYCILII